MGSSASRLSRSTIFRPLSPKCQAACPWWHGFPTSGLKSRVKVGERRGERRGGGLTSSEGGGLWSGSRFKLEWQSTSAQLCPGPNSNAIRLKAQGANTGHVCVCVCVSVYECTQMTCSHTLTLTHTHTHTHTHAHTHTQTSVGKQAHTHMANSQNKQKQTEKYMHTNMIIQYFCIHQCLSAYLETKP